MVLSSSASHPFLAAKPEAATIMPIEHQPTGAFVIHPAGRKDAAAIAEGLGRQLMAAVAEAALQRGWRKAILRVYAGNSAEGFYRALGGRYDGMRQHAIDGHAVRSLAFAWDDVASLLPARPAAG